MRRAECRNVKLALLDLVDQLNPTDRDGGMRKAFESSHWFHSLFGSSMILFDHII